MKDKFSTLLKNVTKVVLAVSGGPDSMAMAHLFKKKISRNIEGLVITVDHNLRPESEQEAVQVGQWIKDMGLPHKILKWDEGKKVKGNIEQKARLARYQLLIEQAQKEKAQAVLIAHHQDDQIESFFLALNRGSGVKGLSGMKEIREEKGIQIIRPLLACTKSDLKKYCETHKIPFVEDPMNEDEKFDRVKIRKNRDKIGVKDERILLAMKNLNRAQEAISFYATETKKRMKRNDGTWSLPPLLEVPAEVVLRTLGNLIQEVGGEAYPPELEKLERLYNKLSQKENFKITLGSCILSADNLRLKVEKE